MSTTIRLTQDKLIELLAEKNGAQMVTIIASTDAKLKKTGNPYANVRKVSRVNGVVNFNYTNAVNKQREREGKEADFEAKERKWGKRIEGTPFVQHNDAVYLEVKVERSLGHQYIDQEGKFLTDEEVAPFLPAKKPQATQELDKEIILRDYNLANLLEISFGGQTYTL